LPKKIEVGDHEIMESKSAKLLGMDNDQKWKSHSCGKGGLLSSLNQRLFMVKIISNHISNNKLCMDIQTNIWTTALYRRETDSRTTKNPVHDNGTKISEQNAKNP
jgi:hypothetical protein